MKKIVITVDGWSSCGKSTMARQLAKKLNYIFVDSGAMYRAITLFFIRNQVDCTDKQAISSALAQVHLSFQLNEGSGNNEIWLNNENVASLIREMPVAEKVSEVAALGEVREFAVAQQQLIGAEKGIVMDGRDIGTTVFPTAEIKLFMTADSAIRVERRLKELEKESLKADFWSNSENAGKVQQEISEIKEELAGIEEIKPAATAPASPPAAPPPSGPPAGGAG